MNLSIPLMIHMGAGFQIKWEPGSGEQLFLAVFAIASRFALLAHGV